jgi:hypothetical protein
MADPVLVVLGGAVVKTAVRLWVGPNVLADTLTADLTNLLESRVGDARERRKLRRRFEEMEDIVAEQVLSALEVEFRDLEEGERNAAVAAVTETFDRARITDADLFSRDLDPLNLEKYVRRFKGNATRDLSGGGVQLFDRILARCCGYILEIADKLPRFQTGAFAELLKRDSQILAKIEDVLTRLPAPVGDDGTASHVATAYLQRIAKVFDRLGLFGLDFNAQWYALTIAYVNLTVSTKQATEDPIGTFQEWLEECPRLFIEGLAGSGKTTILQWLSVQAARREFESFPSQFNEYIPFFVRLREYAGKPLPQPEEFLDKVAPLLAPECRTWPREQLRSGKAFVLIDGVDEVPQAQRAAVLAWINDLTELFPEARYVVTTRPGAINIDALEGAGFVFATLNPMDPPQIRTFVNQWHRAMAEWQKDIDFQEELKNVRDQLLRTLENDRFLIELANTPLLAGLICALNQHLNAQLPRRRSEIFEKALAMFYERDRKRGVRGDITLDFEATFHLLGDLALWMTRNGVVETTADSARDVFRRSSSSLPDTKYGPSELYRHLLLRSGVLREPTADSVDFVHRTFHEYLAARAAIDSDNVGEVVKNASDDQWREIVILASGLGNIRQTTELLQGLLRTTWRGRQRYSRRLIAVACLDEIRGADPHVVHSIENAIPALLPPRSMDQAEALSHAGERLIPHMERVSESLIGPESAPTIRSLALIGSPDALEVIARIAHNSTRATKSDRLDLLSELMRSWQYFEPNDYARNVLSNFDIHKVTATEPRLLPAISELPSVREIELSYFVDDGTDLSALDGLQFRSLILSNCKLNSLSGIIRPWPAVERVDLLNCHNLEQISVLLVLPSLKSVFIRGCKAINGPEIKALRSARKAVYTP